MRIEWKSEGAGCHLAGCGLKTRVLIIPDSDFKGLTEAQREKYIDTCVQDEFDNSVYPTWAVSPLAGTR